MVHAGCHWAISEWHIIWDKWRSWIMHHLLASTTLTNTYINVRMPGFMQQPCHYDNDFWQRCMHSKTPCIILVSLLGKLWMNLMPRPSVELWYKTIGKQKCLHISAWTVSVWWTSTYCSIFADWCMSLTMDVLHSDCGHLLIQRQDEMRSVKDKPISRPARVFLWHATCTPVQQMVYRVKQSRHTYFIVVIYTYFIRKIGAANDIIMVPALLYCLSPVDQCSWILFRSNIWALILKKGLESV